MQKCFHVCYYVVNQITISATFHDRPQFLHSKQFEEHNKAKARNVCAQASI